MSNFQQDYEQYKSQFIGTPSEVSTEVKTKPVKNDFQSDLAEYRAKTQEMSQESFGGVAQEAQNKAQIAKQEFTIEQERQAIDEELGLNKQLNNEVVENIDQPVNVELVEGGQKSVLPSSYAVTQKFGNYNPAIEPSKDGINYGTDFGTPEGTPLAVPPGTWTVVKSYKQAQQKGYIGNRENAGYGNSVVLKNTETGEIMRFSHLKPNTVAVKGGEELKGGTIFAQTGSTGNVTGPHLDLEYYNSQGRVGDIQATSYRKYLFGR